ncbi:SDR family oxidoreductase [Ferroplasma sp.]|uniref:SDR family oxidoreductase n=1 Tax=Ferroplasma sp. TaxID=2591003 RepID=UPI00307CE1F3
MEGLKNKNAIVCAGSTGIGRGVISVLADYGVNVTTFSRHGEKLESLKEDILRQTGNEINIVSADLSKMEDLKRVVESAHSHFGKIDFLIMNYGDPKVEPFINLSEFDWDYSIDMLLKSTIRMANMSAKDMIVSNSGKIIFITSMTTKNPIEDFSISNSLRSGIVALGKTLSIELGKYNINVNSISQGYFYTERLKNIFERKAKISGDKIENIEEQFRKEIPLGRFGKPEEVGNLVAFLCSGLSSYITGTNISVDGGVIKSI